MPRRDTALPEDAVEPAVDADELEGDPTRNPAIGTLAGGKPLRPPPLQPLGSDTGDAADDEASG